MKRKLSVLLDPHFRTLDQIFSNRDLRRLKSVSNLVWGRDDPIPESELDAIRGQIDIIVTGTWRHGNVASFPQLRAIMEVGGRHWPPATIDYRHCFANGIHVLSCAPAFAPMVAEMALGLALCACRNIAAMDRSFRDGTETYQSAGNAGAFTLYGKHIGIVGFGNLARALLPLLQPFRPTISAYDPWLPESAIRKAGAEPLDLPTLLAGSDVIFVMAISTPENKGMLGRDLLQKVREGSVFVLISRSHVVDFDALVDLVSQGRFRLAADVFPLEPVEPDHPVRRLRNAVLTPHIAGSVWDDIKAIGSAVVDDIESISRGIPPRAMQPASAELIHRL